MRKISVLNLPPLAIPGVAIAWLVVCLILSALFFSPYLPWWGIAGCVIIALWRYRMLQRKRPPTSRTIRLLLAALVIGSVILTFQSYLGREPGLTALLLLTALKLLEINSYRDFMVAVFLCFFLVLGLFLFTQSVLAFLFMSAMILLLTTVVVRVNSPVSTGSLIAEEMAVKLKDLFSSAGIAARLVMASLPLVLVLFLLFPRSSGPLWDLPQGGMGRGRSGFGEFIRPGYVAWLAQSFDTAFRVRFPGHDMPAFTDLYFRGLVLWFTDGDTWFQGVFPFRQSAHEKTASGGICQEIMLEPHFHSWLFALDRPVSFPPWSGRMPGWTFRTEKPVERHLLYRVCSVIRPDSPTDLHPVSRRWGLQLPKRLSPKIRRLAMDLKKNCLNDREIVAAVLNYFRQPSFTYTLNPGYLDRKAPIADFLFRSRKGFCEHYAAAFGVLMRSAGVPTRVLMGYQGGKYNPVGEYLEVRQADAHAWDEVWIEEEGWVRVDPTAVVSPERIAYGAEISRSISSLPSVSEAERSELIRKKLHRNFFEKIWDTLANFWDNLDNNWNLWVIGYDRSRQEGLLDSVGLVDLSWVTLLAVLAGFISIFMFLVRMLIIRQSRLRNPLAGLYRIFCRKMKNRGVERHIWEGPLEFGNRAIQSLPAQRKNIEMISDLYIQMRYGRQKPTAQSLKILRTLIKRLKY
jgi:transglutaminase-like putative cysteine protease